MSLIKKINGVGKISFVYLTATVVAISTYNLLDAGGLNVQAQNSSSSSSQPSTVGDNSNGNTIVPNNNQNNFQSQINVPNIYPLQNVLIAPVNTENDFGFNLSVGVNTLDSRNVTAYLGLIYQPGRTDSHLARMQRLQKETDLLEQQKRLLEAQVSLLLRQADEVTLRIDNMRKEPSSNEKKTSSQDLIPNKKTVGLGLQLGSLGQKSNESSVDNDSILLQEVLGTPHGGIFPIIPDGR